MSGRERKAHTPLGITGKTVGRAQTFLVLRGLAFRACEGPSFGVRPSREQPPVFARARQAPAAPSALRKRRLVNPLSIAKPYHHLRPPRAPFDDPNPVRSGRRETVG